MSDGRAHPHQHQAAQPKWAIPIALIVSLFFLWGVANNLNDVLIAQFRKAFDLQDWQSGLVQSAFYLGYFFCAMPAALFARRYGYKAAIVLGLALYGIGALLFYPAAELRAYSAFLGALFVIASGLAFLETSANPLMTVLGDPAGAERRLNLAQAFNPLGSVAGVLVGRQFILSGVEYTPEQLAALSPEALAQFRDTEAMAAQSSYLVLGLLVLLWAVVVFAVRFPTLTDGPEERLEERVDGPAAGDGGGFRRLLRHRHFLFGVAAQFFYVGAQVGVWSFLIRYSQHALPGTGEKTAAAYLTLSLVAFMAGRFAGTVLMGRVPAERLMGVFAAINVALCLVGAFGGGWLGLGAMIATSFFMSIMFPTIFALSLRGLGPLTKLGSSWLVMAIIGGAAIPVVMGRVSDMASIAVAMVVPGLCFAVVGAFSLAGRAAPVGERDERLKIVATH
ncbi:MULTISPECIES: L-fucose:H+ symporter permease [Nitrospirillum]|uniref:FHS family L-fucose permease-like MFS transporter n=1 Tax=Nitrospirillum amazonense TaxID=28077 RepID=A0A560FKR8_9PROT|nr:L-fucose:H+ symporter permease [Nitrospirillum amazonense]MEC4590817.1 L-fucose:H+ symporter permease [Nitrospirillum amazonense]TWB22203.1 FHS family L-fucose permease-like MFS transporter [Nitrospirillum amazonense]